MVGIEIRINSHLINHIYILNISESSSFIDKPDKYKVNVYLVEDGQVISFEIFHKRDEGIEKLIFLVYESLLSNEKFKQLKNKK